MANRRCSVCGLCGETVKGSGYECSECDFAAHLRCPENPPSLVVEKSKIHEHTLTLLPRQVSFTCNACGLSGDKSPYVCLKCSFMTHKDCIDLPRIVKINRHDHRLSYTIFLGPGEWRCGVCRRRMDGRYGAYSCLRCGDYAVPPRCAVRGEVWDGTDVEGKPEEEDAEDGQELFTIIGDRDIQHFSHEHILRLQDKYTDDVCSGCALPIATETFYSCQECHFFLHERSANLPREKTTFLHVHPLTLCPDEKRSGGPNGPSRCDSCHLHFNGFSYRCLECKDDNIEFDIRCASVSVPFEVSGHKHPLFIDDVPTDEIDKAKICSGCGLEEPKYILSCLECSLHLCVTCAALPHKAKYKYDEHFLSIHTSRSVHFEVSGHEHPLFIDDVPTDEIDKAKICSGCGLEEPKCILTCLECDFNLCLACATLPHKAKYKYDEHLVSIHTDLEDSTGRYWCDVCEKKIDEMRSYYKCSDCGPVLHTNCAVGSFRHMRLGLSFTSHGHEYQVVRNEWTSQLRCSNCDNDCHEPLLLMSTTTTDVTCVLLVISQLKFRSQLQFADREQKQERWAIPKAVKDLWDKWNIRGLVIFSLVLQAILVILSPNRKRTPRRLFRLLIWSAYLLANWSADYAVGQISDSSGDDPEPNESPKTNELLAFWAMFLLLNLGGPDTITALALEDNELWLRSLFGLVCQFIATLYIFLLSIPNSLLVPTSLMLVSGVIKYAERIHAMRGASLEKFKDSMLGEPEPGINYTRFMEEYRIRKISKERIQLVRVPEPKKEQGVKVSVSAKKECLTHLKVVHHAYKYFNIYKGLVVDFIYCSQQWIESKQFFQSLSPEDALRILEVKLSFIYGTLFTKVDILHTWIGAAFRFIGLGCLFISLYIFKASEKDGYDGFDVGLTYALLFGGIVLDFISILIFFVSDWTFARLRKPKKDLDKKDTTFDKFLNWLLGFRELKWKKRKCPEQEDRCHMVLDRLFIFRRWSEYVYAYNLIGSSLKIKPKRVHHTRGYIHSSFDAIIRSLYIARATDIIIQGAVSVSKALNRIREKIDLHIISLFIKHRVKYYLLYPVRLFLRFWFGIPLINYLLEFFGIPDQLNEMVFTSRERLTAELWEFIFKEVKRRSLFVVGMESASHIYSARGDWILRDMGIEIDNEKVLRHVTEVDYDQSILVWHIATELLQHTGEGACAGKELSKTLSEYMMYLLIVQPSLMSTVAGIDKVRFRDAIAEARNLQEAKKLFQRTHVADSRDAKRACEAIVASYNPVERRNEITKGYRNKSVLFQASVLAKELMRIHFEEDDNKMWEVVSRVWVEMLCYAATHCDSKQHAAQLNKGGELINFVWLLMAHFGLGEQFRTTKEDSRARLVLELATTTSLV